MVDLLFASSGIELEVVAHAPPKPLVLGRHLLDLGVPAGPEMGTLLKKIDEKQLDGEVTTLEEGIALARTLLNA